MKKISLSEHIAKLRREKGITQEQLASALNISPQAVSKWETDTCQPDTQTLPLIADYFGVSIDYLFYGEAFTYDDILGKIFQKVAAHPQMSKDSYEDALAVFGYAHHGISNGNLKGQAQKLYDEPAHISNENGVSLLSGKGYGAILTRDFFKNISRETAEFARMILPALSDKNRLLVCMAILSMSDISYGELKEKLGFLDEELRGALAVLVADQLVIEEKSKHQSLGFTYKINDQYHTCLCILIATLEMQRYSLTGIACCMGFGDYPINL